MPPAKLGTERFDTTSDDRNESLEALQAANRAWMDGYEQRKRDGEARLAYWQAEMNRIQAEKYARYSGPAGLGRRVRESFRGWRYG